MEPVGVWEWFWLILVFAIPILNLIVFLIIALGAGKPSVVNFTRASLLWLIIAFALGLMLVLAAD